MRYIFANILLTICLLPLAAQNVTNVDFWQEGKKVNISYNLDKTADVSVSISTDGGKSFSSPLIQVTGGVGKGVTPGNNTIVWDVLSEYDKLVGDNICFLVSAKGGKRSFTVKGVKFNMVSVEGGTFYMGATPEQQNPDSDEKPIHRVTLSNYYIGETEVTQALWKAVMGYNPSRFQDIVCPVEQVSWNDCQSFIRRLNTLTGAHFRLPTEAEWEFAARGGNKSRIFPYSGSDNINEIAWYYINADNKTHPVGTKSPNELGIYDMSGNVYEWCQDLYGSYSDFTQIAPQGPSSGTGRVHRGGGWSGLAEYCRSANRRRDLPDFADDYLGLRLALSE